MKIIDSISSIRLSSRDPFRIEEMESITEEPLNEDNQVPSELTITEPNNPISNEIPKEVPNEVINEVPKDVSNQDPNKTTLVDPHLSISHEDPKEVPKEESNISVEEKPIEMSPNESPKQLSELIIIDDKSTRIVFISQVLNLKIQI